jgi:hypothetical protein
MGFNSAFKGLITMLTFTRMCVLEFLNAYTNQSAFPFLKLFTLMYIITLETEMSFYINVVVAL